MNIYLKEKFKWKYFKNVRKNEFLKRNIKIGDYSIIGDYSEIGDDVVIGDGVTIGKGVTICDTAKICNKATIYDGSTIGYGSIIGDDVRIEYCAKIGEYAKIMNNEDIIIISNLGSFNSPMTAYKHNGSIRIGIVGYLGEISDFEEYVEKKYGNNRFGIGYKKAIKFVREYFNVI